MRWSPSSEVRCSAGFIPLPQVHCPNREFPWAANLDVPQPLSMAACASDKEGGTTSTRVSSSAKASLLSLSLVVSSILYFTASSVSQVWSPGVTLWPWARRPVSSFARPRSSRISSLMRSTIGAMSRKKSLFLSPTESPLAPGIGHIREVDARDLADARLPRLLGVAQAVEQGEHVLVVAARNLLVGRCDLREHRHGQQSRHERFRKQGRGFHRGLL